jgi:hypothetical protein
MRRAPSLYARRVGHVTPRPSDFYQVSGGGGLADRVIPAGGNPTFRARTQHKRPAGCLQRGDTGPDRPGAWIRFRYAVLVVVLRQRPGERAEHVHDGRPRLRIDRRPAGGLVDELLDHLGVRLVAGLLFEQFAQ